MKKNNHMTYAAGEDTDQPRHPSSLIRVLTTHKVHSKESDQTGQMSRLI